MSKRAPDLAEADPSRRDQPVLTSHWRPSLPPTGSSGISSRGCEPASHRHRNTSSTAVHVRSRSAHYAAYARIPGSRFSNDHPVTGTAARISARIRGYLSCDPDDSRARTGRADHLSRPSEPECAKPCGRSWRTGNVHLLEPLEYRPFVFLMDNSYLILTDSGGVQKKPSLGNPSGDAYHTERPSGEGRTVGL